MTQPITLQGAQKIVDDWIKKFGVRYFSELTQLAQLTEEVGELARIISRTYGLFVLICLANQTGTDLTNAFLKNMQRKTKRDKMRHTKNKKLLRRPASK